jgi:hypothetical protein
MITIKVKLKGPYLAITVVVMMVLDGGPDLAIITSFILVGSRVDIF